MIGLLAPFFLFPSINYIGLLIIIPLIWICRRIVKKEFFERTILDWAIAILLIQVFATCIIVPDLSFSLPKIAGVLFGVFFFYSAVALLISRKLIKFGIAAFLGGGLILSVVGLLGIKWTHVLHFEKMMLKIAENIPKIKTNLPGVQYRFNSNAIGGVLILIIPLSFLILLSYLKGKKENYLIVYKPFALMFFSVILFVLCSILFLTQSLGSWLGILIGIWILLFPFKWKKWSVILILLSVVCLALLDANKTKLIIDEVKIDIAFREPWWLEGTNTIIQHPFFGIGMNQFRQIPAIGYEVAHAHNHPLHTAAELGIPGLIAYLAILIGVGFMCFEIWRKSNTGWMRIAVLGLGCGQLAHLIFGIGDSIPLGAKVGIFFWFSLGLITAMYNLTIKEVQAPVEAKI